MNVLNTDKLICMLSNELSLHPKAQLIDLFKLYMQSAFGPGHIIKDVDSARHYLRVELDSLPSTRHRYDVFHCDTFFPYARYSLYLLIDNIISFDEYFNAFIRTASESQSLDDNLFRYGWNVAIEYLAEKNIANFIIDKEQIDQLLALKKYLVSHSTQYRELYMPAYRVINCHYINIAPTFLK